MIRLRHPIGLKNKGLGDVAYSTKTYTNPIETAFHPIQDTGASVTSP